MLIYLIPAYLLVAFLLCCLWAYQGHFPDHRDGIDNAIIGLLLLIWPITLCILAWALYVETKDQ